MNSKIRELLVVSMLLTLSACGFQLRGQAGLPFESLYISVPAGHPIGAELKRAIRAGSSTRIVDEARDAQATLQIVSAVNEKHILSLSGGGKVREFQLRYRVSFRLADAKGMALIPVNEITLKRDFSFNDTQVLAKEAEEALLNKDMQTDAVQQVMRRLAAAKLP